MDQEELEKKVEAMTREMKRREREVSAQFPSMPRETLVDELLTEYDMRGEVYERVKQRLMKE